MRQQIHLFIGDREIEFSQPPQILYNYQETELRNPTIVKNSFSKNIEIEGTPQNNDVFGHIWRLDRNQQYGEGGGINFNPNLRVDFKLFVNEELYEKGYCKLNEINKTGNDVTYSITLYGGLGSFFAALSYSDGDTDTKKTLADLKFDIESYADDGTLDFEITKETVQEAWNQLQRITDDRDKWDILNFAVTSEGIPDDFGADRALINTYGCNIDGIVTTSGDYHTIINGQNADYGYALGEIRQELTMDNSFDLRSYLLRPVISVQKIIEAIQDPVNNNGYQVSLDSHFFDRSNNPYFGNAWMTLPRMRDLGIEKDEIETKYATLSSSGSNFFSINYSSPSLSNISNAEISFRVNINAAGSNDLELSTVVTCPNSTGSSNIKDYKGAGGLGIRLEALDAGGKVIAASRPIFLAGRKNNQYDKLLPAYKRDLGIKNGAFTPVWGYFKKVSGTYTFCDVEGNPITFTATLSTTAPFASLRLSMYNPYFTYEKYAGFWGGMASKTVGDILPTSMRFYYNAETTYSGNHTLADVQSYNSVTGTWGISVVGNIKLIVKNYEGFFSGTKIEKGKLLHTDYTPADFLLSYAKLFGLYFYMDPTETAVDPESCPNGVIHIMDRDTFYTDEVINVNELIDRRQQINIVPRTAESKWYSFSYEDGDGQAEKKYQNVFGYSYGRQLVNTQSNFNKDIKELLDSNIFKNGVMVLEKNGYYSVNSDGVENYVYDNMKYHLFKKSGDDYDSQEFTMNKKIVPTAAINPDNLIYYDSIPKLQVHNDEMGSGDGNNILLFFTQFISTVDSDGSIVFYNITDDLADMVTLNDGTPCWLYTKITDNESGDTIAIRRASLPLFTRDIYEGGRNGNILHSWNFGHPQETYVPNTYTMDTDCIYDKCWRNYIRDLYNDNARVVKAYLHINSKPNPSWLRRYYWWDNAIWRINQITDWNISSYDSTMVEFIKVQDTADYQLDKISFNGNLQFVLYDYVADATGETIYGKITQPSSTSRWAFSDGVKITYSNGTVEYLSTPSIVSPTTGTGVSTNLTLTIPYNSSHYPRTLEFSVIDGMDLRHFAYVEQNTPVTSQLYFASASTTIGWQSGNTNIYFYAYNIPLSSITKSISANWLRGTIYNTTQGSPLREIASYYDENTGSQRTLTISLTGTGYDGQILTASTTVIQEAKPEAGWVKYDVSAITVSSAASSVTIGYTYGNIKPETLWAIQGIGDDWIWVESSGSSSVTFAYSANTTTQPRTASLELNAEGLDGSNIWNYQIGFPTYLTQLTGTSTIDVSPETLHWDYMHNGLMKEIGVSGTSGTYTITLNE